MIAVAHHPTHVRPARDERERRARNTVFAALVARGLTPDPATLAGTVALLIDAADRHPVSSPTRPAGVPALAVHVAGVCA